MTETSETAPVAFESDDPGFQAMLYETRREFAVFDALPAPVRAALREAEFTWFTATEVRYMLERGFGEADVISEIRKSDQAVREALEKQRALGVYMS